MQTLAVLVRTVRDDSLRIYFFFVGRGREGCESTEHVCMKFLLNYFLGIYLL